MKYKKKPVVIEAIQWNGNNFEEILEFTEGNFHKVEPYPIPIFVIETLEGNMEAKVGDYIIRGIGNEFYPCKENIFHATYEPVEE